MNHVRAHRAVAPRRPVALLGTAAVVVVALLVAVVWVGRPATVSAAPARAGQAKDDAPAGLKKYETKYYLVYTDLQEDDARETGIRMTRMAEEYYERTKDFSGKINRKFPFYLFKDAEDYYAAGAIPGSAGVFMGDKLMAIAVDNEGGGTWHVVQHEGFHQFAHAVIGGERPTWVNEGLAEYFGESVWTGDGFVTGVIDPRRLKRVKEGVEAKRYKSIPVMMQMTLRTWNSGLSVHNYDQAWSMTQFLAHGENGRYQKAFAKFMNLLGKGQNPDKSWQDSFGDANGFQQRWETWVTGLPESPTSDLYARARIATLTSYLARAFAQKQAFDTLEEFMTAAAAGELKASQEDWLPPSLLRRTLAMRVNVIAKEELDPKSGKTPRLVYTLDDGRKLVGNFTLKGTKVGTVWVDEDDTDRVIAEARKLIDDGKKDAARDMLQACLRKNPKSTRAEEMRAMVLEAKK